MTHREILDKLRNIEDRLEKLERAKQKRNLPFNACIPPLSLCRDIVKTYDSRELGNFDFQMQQLADYYGINRMDNRHNPERVPEKAIACYHRFEQTAFYKTSNANLETVLHEFFHHLYTNNVVCLGEESEEKLADRFSQIVMKRGRD